MSKSYHITFKDLKGKTKLEIDAMTEDPDSILHELVEKGRVKRIVKKERKNKQLLS